MEYITKVVLNIYYGKFKISGKEIIGLMGELNKTVCEKTED